MQQNVISEIQQWLPEIDPCQIELTNGPTEEKHQKDLNEIAEYIHAWAIPALEKAKLPITPHEAKALLEKYPASSNEGCALHVVLELDALHASISNTDANTAALASMKLFEAIWQHAITTLQQVAPQITKQDSIDNQQSSTTSHEESEENIQLYRATINELQKKYPHCNINALRLLASTRLNVTKQQLDDLEISPQ